MNAPSEATDMPTRRCLKVRGIVQGVGFRPFVYRLATELSLDGWVRNDASGVTIDVQGDAQRVGELTRRIREEAPALARVDSVVAYRRPPRAAHGFAIRRSDAGRPTTTAIGIDSAVCVDCLDELFDRTNRRYRYAFINCTNCGPRYTITRALPYDRTTTSMAAFTLCAACAAEYASPPDRRFHAEPNACPACGPRLSFADASGSPAAAGDPVAGALAALLRGDIVAVKGLGGFHLACDARNAGAVARLRARKTREEKPFAVMVANEASLADLAIVDSTEHALLASAERPIVLLRKRVGADVLLPGVAPGLDRLGVMLPHTPLQYLLFHEACGRPDGRRWLTAPQPLVLVMTSANPGGEPLVVDNDEASRRLGAIADRFLLHDRGIVTRCDDSVVRANAASMPQFVRRARGYTPRAIRLASTGPCVAALGGYFKSTVCVTRGDEAFVSQHIGDLDNAATCRALVDAVLHLTTILGVAPEAVAHDLHPDFFSSRHAVRLARDLGIPALGVQHHHAHIAAIAAEHRLQGSLLGVALDGIGYGGDASAWGGELLRVDGARCERIGRLRPLRLPGGDRAAREPWRMAAAALALGGRGDEIVKRFAAEPAARSVASMLETGFNVPAASSMGRWFDAAAGMLGVCTRMTFEGQAAMLLEGLAHASGPVEADPQLYRIDDALELDLASLLMRLADVRDPARGAALFHSTLVAALSDWIVRASNALHVRTVACGGGCFLNATLARRLRDALRARGLDMVEASAVPPNDGGLSLGQAWVARQAMAER